MRDVSRVMDTTAHLKVLKRTGLVLLVVVLGVSWSPFVAALDRVGAIDAARKQVKHKCTDATPCTFTARQEGNRWQVRVEFTKRATPQDKPVPYKGGHAIFVFDQGGRVVGRVEGR
jgi:hypothetical protein